MGPALNEGAPRRAASRLAILSPFFEPAVGGAAVYYKLLATRIAGREPVGSVTVFTERFPGAARRADLGDRVTVERRLPFRAGRAGKPVLRYLLYLWQNVMLALLPIWLPRDVRWLLVHASFQYHPNALWIGLRWLRRRRGSGIALVLDVRDPKPPRALAGQARVYDAAICCGDNVVERMREIGVPEAMIVGIPVPMTLSSPSAAVVARVLDAYGLERGGYVFSPNGISVEKRTPELLHAIGILRDRGAGTVLVVAGRNRDWSAGEEAAAEAGALRYVGMVSHEESLALTAGAALVVAISEVESFSRAAVEAMSLGTPSLLPPTVPEFRASCGAYVTRSVEPRALAEQIDEVLSGALAPPAYDFERHSPERVVPAYVELFDSLAKRGGAAA